MNKNEEIDNDCNEQEKRNNEDPGAARLGNFINYYRFNPVKFPNHFQAKPNKSGF